MTKQKIIQILGDTYQYVTDGVYEFPGVVVGLLNSIRAWDNLWWAFKISLTEKYDIYLVIAENGSYFKADGQNGCVQIIIHNKETKEAFLDLCRCTWNAKEIIKEVAYYKRHITENLTHEYLNNRLTERKREYPWLIFITKGDKVFPYDYNK